MCSSFSHLQGVEENDVQAGFIICSPDALVSVSRVFDAEVRGVLSDLSVVLDRH